MKKPKITEGEWETNEKGNIYAWGNAPETSGYTPCIAKVSIWEDANEKGLTNAIAIQAVPDMIDALIEAYHLIQALKSTGEWGVNVHPIDEENIVNALKKAGCTDD